MPQTLNLTKVRSDSGGNITPPGTILPWSKSTPPSGFLKCDGSAVSRTTYSALFEVIGTTYGSGDGSSTFNVPNLTSRMSVGANSSTNVTQTDGAVDTTGAGFSLQNNLSAQNTNNLATQDTQNISTSTVGNVNLSAQTTQNLGVSVTENLGISVTENLSTSTTQNLSGSVSGNIATHTLSLAQLPSHNHPGNAGPYNVFPDGGGPSGTLGNMGGFGQSGSNQAHNHGHNFSGSVSGNVAFNKSGNIAANKTGSVTGSIGGSTAYTLTGDTQTNVTGNVATGLSGDVGANLSGNVTVQNASLYHSHLVVIYIIKT